MILPSKTIKPVDSLIYISSHIIREMGHGSHSIDEVLAKVNKSIPKKISIETLLLCFNYLYIIGKLENEHETVKIKL
jgi:hypothetical protein